MKRALFLFSAVALVAVSCSRATKPDNGARVMVIGIDGGTWSMIEPMMEAGELPNIKKLYDAGVHGILESRPPILSPVVWTTIFSGFGFQKHGVKDWKTSQSTNRRVNAIWEIFRDEKKRVDVFNVPATWPPDAIPGVMLSGFPLSGATYGGNTGDLLTKDKLANGKLSVAYKDSVDTIRETVSRLPVRTWSPWIDTKVASRPAFRGALRVFRLNEDDTYVTPQYRLDDGLVASEPKKLRTEISKKLGEPYIPEGPGWSKWAEPYAPEVLYDHLEQIFVNQSRAAQMYAGGDWKLFLYVMTFVDRISHPYWAYSHPSEYPGIDLEKAKKYEHAVPDAYRRSDEWLGRILSEVKGQQPYVIIVSDHGFQASRDPEKQIGTHDPDGIYLVSGPGIQPKAGNPTFIEDVTPTILYLMGMPVGQDMDGNVFPDVVQMLRRQTEFTESYEKEKRASSDRPVDNDTWESLRGLGYVDGAPPRAQENKNQPPNAAKNPNEQRPGQPKSSGAKPPQPSGSRSSGAMPPGSGSRSSGAMPPGSGSRSSGAMPPASPQADAPQPGETDSGTPPRPGSMAIRPQHSPDDEAPPANALENWPEAKPDAGTPSDQQTK